MCFSGIVGGYSVYVLFMYRWRLQCVCAVHVSLEVTVCMCFSGIVGGYSVYVLFRYRWRLQCVCAVQVSLEVTVCMCFSGIVGGYSVYVLFRYRWRLEDVLHCDSEWTNGRCYSWTLSEQCSQGQGDGLKYLISLMIQFNQAFTQAVVHFGVRHLLYMHFAVLCKKKMREYMNT